MNKTSLFDKDNSVNCANNQEHKCKIKLDFLLTNSEEFDKYFLTINDDCISNGISIKVADDSILPYLAVAYHNSTHWLMQVELSMHVCDVSFIQQDKTLETLDNEVSLDKFKEYIINIKNNTKSSL